MSRRRLPTRAERALENFWASAPLSRWARALIIVAAVLSFFSDLPRQLSEAGDASAGTALVVLLMGHAALVVVAFRVSIGAAIVAGTMVVSVFWEFGLPIGIIGLAVSGVVVAKSSRLFAGSYVAYCVLWFVGSYILHEEVRVAVFLIGPLLIVSVAVGATYAALAERNAAAVDRISGFEQETRQSIRGERNRIARELHDIVAHHVTMASMHANVAAMAQSPEQREKSLNVIAASTREALVELRWMLGVLQSDEDESRGGEGGVLDLRLVASIPAIQRHLEGLGFITTVDHEPEELADLPVEADITLGKILQEAATNVVKYADRAAPVRIRARRITGGVELLVHNVIARPDGPATDSSGMGLENMRSRARERGGTVETVRDGSTWTVRCELPLG